MLLSSLYDLQVLGCMPDNMMSLGHPPDEMTDGVVRDPGQVQPGSVGWPEK